MRFTFSITTLLLSVVYGLSGIYVLGCTAEQMGRTQSGTKAVQDTANGVASVTPPPVNSWAELIAAAAGVALLAEKTLSKYVVPAGVATAKNAGTSPSPSTTVSQPISQPATVPLTTVQTIPQPNSVATVPTVLTA